MTKEETFITVWNSYPRFCRCERIANGRLREFQRRVKEPYFCQNWRKALEHAHNLAFCCGQHEGGWRATVDWFLRPDTVSKLLEGTYDFAGRYKEPKKKAPPQHEEPPTPEELQRRKLILKSLVEGFREKMRATQ